MRWIWEWNVGARYVPAATTPATTTLRHSTTLDVRYTPAPYCTYYYYTRFLSLSIVSPAGWSGFLNKLPPNCSDPALLHCQYFLSATSYPTLYYRSLLPVEGSPRIACLPFCPIRPLSAPPPPPPSALASITPVSSPLAPPASATARSKIERSSEGERDKQRMWRQAAFVLV